MRTLTVEEIKDLFSKKELQKAPIPNLEAVEWENLDFFRWFDRNDNKALLVYEGESGLVGLVLEKNRNRQVQQPTAYQCSWCASPHIRTGIATYCYRNKKTQTSTICHMLCADLGCSDYIRSIRKPSGILYGDMATVETKIERVRGGVERFIRQVESM